MKRKYYTANADQKDQIVTTIAAILMKADDVPFHDIDIGVFYAGNNRLQIFEDANTLATILSRKTGYQTDVRMLNNAPVSFVYNVLKGKKIYVKNEDNRC